MSTLIIIFGALTLLAGLLIVINPEIIFGYLRNNYEKLSLHIIAVVLRLVLGVLLIWYAADSRYPLLIEVLGWLSIAAAMTFGVIGRQRFIRLMAWAFSLLHPYGRIGGVFAMLFGGFLVHAFV